MPDNCTPQRQTGEIGGTDIIWTDLLLEEETSAVQASCKMLLPNYKHPVCADPEKAKKAPAGLFSLSQTTPILSSQSFSVYAFNERESHLQFLTPTSQPGTKTAYLHRYATGYL